MKRKSFGRRDAVALGILSLAALAASPATHHAAAQDVPAVSAPQETAKAGLQAEIIECKRQDGVLSIKLRLRNTGDKDTDLTLIENRNFYQYFVTAGGKKYLLLEDSEHVPLATPTSGSGALNVKIAKGGTWVWWGRYPAPPAEIKKVSFYTPVTPPFDGVLVSE